MEIKILSPQWGHEHLPLDVFLDKIRLAGYHGIDTSIPDNANDKKLLFDYLQQYEMLIVTHQHSADGSTFDQFRASFLKNLYLCAEPCPVLINSHTGRDWFTFEQNLALVDIALEFSDKTKIQVVHETHRGRLGYSPQIAQQYFDCRKDFCITADLSHWTCVTESLLENFATTVSIATQRARHVHARVGYENGPQIPDPSAPEWNYALDHFLHWWDRIVEFNRNEGRAILTITTEFGPVPYMQVIPFTGKPVADQFEVNCYMKNLLADRYIVNL